MLVNLSVPPPRAASDSHIGVHGTLGIGEANAAA
jgi:hypothetical protein